MATWQRLRFSLLLSLTTPLLAAQQPTPKVLLSNLPGSLSSLVPGLGGEAFEPSKTSDAVFDRPYGSPNGNWILTAIVESGDPAADEVLLVNGFAVLQEGLNYPHLDPGQVLGFLETKCAINDAGEYAFGHDTDAPITQDDYLVKGDPSGTIVVVAREGAQISGLAPGVVHDNLGTAFLLENGEVGYETDNVDGGPPVSEDELRIQGEVVVLQEGVSIPLGQGGATARAWENFDANDWWASADGTHSICQGDLDGPSSSDDIVAFDNVVVAQEGFVVPGSDFTSPVATAGIGGVHMTTDGVWFARGENADGEDWVLRNGSVIARTGGPVLPGQFESWGASEFPETFFLHVGNGRGQYVLGGVTDAFEPLANSVLVANGTHVVCREGDPVDVDENGQFDDNAFLESFGADDACLSDDGNLIFVATLMDDGFRAHRPGRPRGLHRRRLRPQRLRACRELHRRARARPPRLLPRGRRLLTLTTISLPPGESAYYVASRRFGSIPGAAGGQGTLCAAFDTARFVEQTGSIAANGTFQATLDTSVIPGNPITSATAGETWHFQAWYRDNNPGTTSNFSDSLSVTFEALLP